MTRGLENVINELERTLTRVFDKKSRVLVSVVGRNGSGKSYLGRRIRKQGIGRYPVREIAVIDDGTMFLEFLGIFTRRVKIPTTGVDELEPFVRTMPGRKRIIIYINATPARRITKADILLSLSVDEQTRRARLAGRYGEGSPSFTKYLERPEITDPAIGYTYRIDGETQKKEQ